MMAGRAKRVKAASVMEERPRFKPTTRLTCRQRQARTAELDRVAGSKVSDIANAYYFVNSLAPDSNSTA